MTSHQQQISEGLRQRTQFVAERFENALKAQVGNGLCYDPDINGLRHTDTALLALIPVWERSFGEIDEPKLQTMADILFNDYSEIVEHEQVSQITCGCKEEIDPNGTGDSPTVIEHDCHNEFIRKAMSQREDV